VRNDDKGRKPREAFALVALAASQCCSLCVWPHQASRGLFSRTAIDCLFESMILKPDADSRQHLRDR
jgi:hypothetical protein